MVTLILLHTNQKALASVEIDWLVFNKPGRKALIGQAHLQKLIAANGSKDV